MLNLAVGMRAVVWHVAMLLLRNYLTELHMKEGPDQSECVCDPKMESS